MMKDDHKNEKRHDNHGLADSQWDQIAAIINNSLLPVERVAERIGLDLYKIMFRCSKSTGGNAPVSYKTVPDALSLSDVPANWLTAAELGFLGVRIVGRGVKSCGHIAAPCALQIEFEPSTAFIVAERKASLYPVPVSVILRLWELRPDQEEYRIGNGDALVIDGLLRKVVALRLDDGTHWTNVDIGPHKKELMDVKADDLSRGARTLLRAEVIQIADGEILRLELDNG